MLPPVLAELLSDPKLPQAAEDSLLQVTLLEPQPGFWWRVGKLRATLYRRKYRPKLADSMIAQFCLDYEASLLTRDGDFRAFAKHSELTVL